MKQYLKEIGHWMLVITGFGYLVYGMIFALIFVLTYMNPTIILIGFSLLIVFALANVLRFWFGSRYY